MSRALVVLATLSRMSSLSPLVSVYGAGFHNTMAANIKRQAAIVSCLATLCGVQQRFITHWKVAIVVLFTLMIARPRRQLLESTSEEPRTAPAY
jgi:hypothetical protein